MVNVITIDDVKKLIQQMGITAFFNELITALEVEFSRWEIFQKSPRHAVHVPGGVIELMPTCDDAFYSFKYVNGHPNNTQQNKLNVVAIGLLSDIHTGYPLLISEMTLLTAFRTAATSALAAKYLAKKDAKTIGIIGTGAQSEFQIHAQHCLFPITTVRYFDSDQHAMKKFHQNLQDQPFQLIPCESAKDVLMGCDIITTATAAKKESQILRSEWIKPGVHINAIGGDCPGKTELDHKILDNAKIVVEYLPQSSIEGEIQHLDKNALVYAELWELVVGKKIGRDKPTDITLFDSVGFAIEDFAILKLLSTLSTQYNIGTPLNVIPDIQDPKNLFGLLNN